MFNRVPKERLTSGLVIIYLGLGSMGVIGGLRQTGYLAFLELLAYDSLVQIHPIRPPDPRLLVVGINDEDIKRQKHWPLSDEVVAKTLTILNRYRPKVIALDLFRDVPHPPEHENLRQALKAKNIIVVNQLPSSDGPGVAAPPEVPPDRIGFSDFLIDSDNIIRRELMAVATRDRRQFFLSLGLQASRHYLGLQKFPLKLTPESLQLGKINFPRLQVNSGGYHLPDSEVLGWQILLQYRSREVAHQVTLTDVLQERLDPRWLKDKVVLIGVTAPSEKDTFPTPYSAIQTRNFEMPGVIIHGQIISQILSIALDQQPLPWFWSPWQEWLWLGFWSVLGSVLVWQLQRPLYLMGTLAIAIMSLWGITWLLFIQAGWIPLVPPLLGLLLSATMTLGYRVIYQTYHDTLTGLSNRRFFLKLLQKPHPQLSDSVSSLRAVLFMDLDRFQLVNDGLGHSIGDHILVLTAQRLNQVLQGTHHQLARVGGDEFAICLSRLTHCDQALDIVNRIHQEFSQPFICNEEEIFLTVSIGLVFDPEHKQHSAKELLRYADIAMYRAKELGKDCHALYFPGMDQETNQRWTMEMDLRKAFQHEEFELYYQPIVSLLDLKIIGFEALIRWNSPVRGLVSPGDFIPLAEDNGLIIALGHWILKEACQQIQSWRQKFPEIPYLMMSINLSGRQFSQPNLLKDIQQLFHELKLTGQNIKLEITESSVIDNIEQVLTVLQELKNLGLQLSIDDFGTGYSSLNYLYRFPLDTLKIDKSFIDKISDNGNSDEQKRYIQLVKTIITLGHNLSMDIVAEGIETLEQAEILRMLKCEYGQGYFFSKPLNQLSATQLLEDSINKKDRLPE
ncbi:MAG: EAL domain-containing protein [Snowella sp.]|nr:EAL domain-containing protein [Snowella sp.]